MTRDTERVLDYLTGNRCPFVARGIIFRGHLAYVGHVGVTLALD